RVDMLCSYQPLSTFYRPAFNVSRIIFTKVTTNKSAVCHIFIAKKENLKNHTFAAASSKQIFIEKQPGMSLKAN
ncbi:MAG: hypothetical protein AAFZ15_31720, partial [Bacteroidota bacterium]